MADEFKAKGNAALQAGKAEEAVAFYTQGIEVDASNHVLFSNRSAAYAKLENYAEALNDAEKTVSLKPDWPKGYSRVGLALSFLDRHTEAIDAYEKGLKIDPDNAQLHSGLTEAQTRANTAASDPERNNMFNLPDIVGKLAANPKTREYLADPSYMNMLKSLSENPQDMGLFMKDPRFEATISAILGMDISTAGTSSPMGGGGSSPPRASSTQTTSTPTAAKPTAAAGRKEAATAAAEPEVELSEAEKEKQLGNTAYKQKNFDDALMHYDRAVELDATDMTFLTNKAAVFFEQGKFDECIETCHRAVEVGRENRANFKQIAKAIGRIGSSYLKREEYEDAIKWFNKSLAEHRAPDILRKLQQTEKILKERQRLAYLSPEIALEEKNLGNDAFKKGDFPTALRHYTEAVKRNPEDPKVYSNRAACYTKLAEFRLGLADCDTCIKMDATFVKAYVRKGMIHVALKETSKAAAAFQEALALDPNNADALDGMKKCYTATPAQMSDDEREQAAQRAMADPEVQQIMQDPAMRSILQQMQQDPRALQEHLKNPVIGEKIQKLMDSGLIALR